MKTSIATSILVAVLAAGTIVAAERRADKGAEAVSASRTTGGEPAARKFVLDKGVEAAEIHEHYGAPLEIQPIKSPDSAVKAERWIYRRKSSERVVQDQLSSSMESRAIRKPDGTVETVVVSSGDSPSAQRRRLVITYQVTALLLVNGKLESARQWQQQEEKFD